MDRRSFLKLTAVTGASGVIGGCAAPQHALVRFLPDEEIEPGVAQWKPSVCTLCASGCGLLVRVMDADVEVTRDGTAGVVRRYVAKKLEGNPAHPVNRGGLCPRGHAAIQIAYHPERIAQPLRRAGNRGDGRYEAITWEQAIEELVSALDRLAAANRASALAFFARPGHSHRRMLVERFLAGYGAPPAVTVDLFSDDVLRRANQLSFARDQAPTFDLARARFVLNFGADLLATWNSPVAHSAAYGAMRQALISQRGVLVQCEARMSYTGASADEWVGIAPGSDGALALGLAHVIIREELADPADAAHAGRIVEGWPDLESYAPAHVEALTGVPARRIEELARAFATTRPAVAVIGGPALGCTNALSTAAAVNALNALVGSVERPGGVFFTPQPPWSADPGPSARRFEEPEVQTVAATILAAERAAGEQGEPRALPSTVEAVLIDGANPVFTSPPAWRVREALERVPLIASFGNFLDETSILADLILPDHAFLESWVDALPESGSLEAIASVAAPVMSPLLDTRAMPDVLLEVGRRLHRPLEPPLPWDSFAAMLESSFRELPGTGGEDPWRGVLAQGGWWGSVKDGDSPAPAATEERASATSAALQLAAARFDGDPEQYPFHLLPYPSQAFLDGSTSHLPWLQEMPDPLTSVMWSSWIEINSKTAARLGIAHGDIVEVASSSGALLAPAIVSPGLAPEVVAMPVGQGHRTFTRYASGRGVNPIELLAPMKDRTTGAFAWAATRVRVTRASGADGRLIVFAGSLREPHHGHELR